MILRHYLLCLIVIVTPVVVLIWLYSTNALTLQLPKIDSMGHFFGFFILTWILNKGVKLPLITLSICLILYATLTEVGQHYLGFRRGEFRDFIADILGIGLYAIIQYVLFVRSVTINYYENKK